MHDTISTATSWARVHSLECWNSQQWQRVRATQPRWARNHTKIAARSPPGWHPCCRSRTQRQSSKGSSSICQRVVWLWAHKETRRQCGDPRRYWVLLPLVYKAACMYWFCTLTCIYQNIKYSLWLNDCLCCRLQSLLEHSRLNPFV